MTRFTTRSSTVSSAAARAAAPLGLRSVERDLVPVTSPGTAGDLGLDVTVPS